MVKTVGFRWSDIEYACEDITKHLRETFKNKRIRIITASRGGLVPTAIISNLLDTTDVYVVNVHSYDDREQHRLIHKGLVSQSVPPKPDDTYVDIFIDDINDSGSTITYVKNLYKVDYVCTLIEKEGTKDKSDYAHTGCSDDIWVEFPWEKREEI